MRPDTPCPRPATDTLANWPGRALAHVPRTAGGGGGPHGDVMAPPHLLLPERAVVPTASLRSLLIEYQRQKSFPTGSPVTRDRLRSECGADRFASLAPYRMSETEKIFPTGSSVSASFPRTGPRWGRNVSRLT